MSFRKGSRLAVRAAVPSRAIAKPNAWRRGGRLVSRVRDDATRAPAGWRGTSGAASCGPPCRASTDTRVPLPPEACYDLRGSGLRYAAESRGRGTHRLEPSALLLARGNDHLVARGDGIHGLGRRTAERIEPRPAQVGYVADEGALAGTERASKRKKDECAALREGAARDLPEVDVGRGTEDDHDPVRGRRALRRRSNRLEAHNAIEPSSPA